MTFKAFQQMIVLLKKDFERSRKLHKLGFDDIQLKEELQQVIDILLKSHYSKEGEDMISWWIWEDVEKFLYDEKGNKIKDLSKMEDLWEYVEEIRKSSTFEEYNPEIVKKRTKKQMQELFKQMFNTQL